MTRALQAACEWADAVANRHESLAAGPHACTVRCGTQVNVIGQGVGGRFVGAHQLQLVCIGDGGAALHLQEGARLAGDHQPIGRLGEVAGSSGRCRGI